MNFKKYLSRIGILSVIVLFNTISSAQGGVGIGLKDPQATLHVRGISTPGGDITRTLLDENFNTYVVDQISNQTGDGCYTDGWITRNDPPASYKCIPCTNMMLFINSNSPGFPRTCGQDATAIVTFAATPITTQVDISFDFRFQVYQISDRFRVYLHNETTDTQVALGDYQSATPQTPIEFSYSGAQTVVAGNSYSIRFHYTANDGWGVTVDNVLVTELLKDVPESHVFRLEDGSEDAGKVLTAADSQGNAYWASPGGSPKPANDTGMTADVSSEGNRDSKQQQRILTLQKAIEEQEVIFDRQSERIERLEGLLGG